MDVRHFISLLLGAQSVYSKYIQIKPKEKNQIINAINAARKDVAIPALNLSAIIWNYPLEIDIKKALPINRTWLFAESNKYKNTIDFKVNFNLMFLMKEEAFKKYINYNYIFHDTCNNKSNDVLNIFKFRIKEKHCFAYNNCSSAQFTNYQTCSSVPIVRGSGLPCSWSWRYYTPLIRDDLKSIACVRFSYPGPYTPNKQKDSFGCYGEVKAPINDIPYKIKL